MDQQLYRQHGLDHDLDQDTANKGGPGKSSLTSRLTPAPQVVFRVADPETARALGESLSGGTRARIQREADGAVGGRDGNGVAVDAEAAVDRASSSNGAPLPTSVQRQFEGSLGADLSSVRVHTGSESAQAAHAVGAKAYTVGQDIHFAAGRYQPEDPFGMHLLAHEVAHTVQQAGGAQRRQHKLEVSTPQDAAEHEADRAADAMVRGAPAPIALAPGRGLARDPDDELPDTYDDMKKNSSAAEKDAAKSSGFVQTGKLSTINDSAAAQKAIGDIDGTQAAVIDGESAGLSEWQGASSKNIAAKAALEDFVAQNDVQNTAVTNFRSQYQLVITDYARLEASAGTFMAANMGAKPMKGDQATNMAKSLELTGGDRDLMKEKVADGGPLHAVWAKARDTKNALKAKSGNMASAQTRMIAGMQNVAAKQMQANAGVHAATTSDDDKKKALDAVKKQISDAKGAWDAINKVVGKPASAAADKVLPGAGAAVDKALQQVPALIDAWHAKALAAASIANANSEKLNELRAVAAAQEEAAAASTSLKADAMEYSNLAAEVAQLRSDLENDMKNLGQNLDKTMVTGNKAYAQITKLTGDLVRFTSQANATLAIGKQEQTQAKAVKEKTNVLVSKDTGKGMPWYSARPRSALEIEAGVHKAWKDVLVWNQLGFTAYAGNRDKGGGGSARGEGGANENVDEAVASIEKIIGQATQLETSLNNYLFNVVD
ncbi:MAG: DUF4157 domain-containing protein [Myxococcales bacterium]|nr:DUF4157 domain-containing protein [Myxococcales bacterium]